MSRRAILLTDIALGASFPLAYGIASTLLAYWI